MASRRRIGHQQPQATLPQEYNSKASRIRLLQRLSAVRQVHEVAFFLHLLDTCLQIRISALGSSMHLIESLLHLDKALRDPYMEVLRWVQRHQFQGHREV